MRAGCGNAGGGSGGWAPPPSGAAAGLAAALRTPAGSFPRGWCSGLLCRLSFASPAAPGRFWGRLPLAAGEVHSGGVSYALPGSLRLSGYCCWTDGASLARTCTREPSTHPQVSQSPPSTPNIAWLFAAMRCAVPLPWQPPAARCLLCVPWDSLRRHSAKPQDFSHWGWIRGCSQPPKSTVRQGTRGAAGASIVTAIQSSRCFCLKAQKSTG